MKTLITLFLISTLLSNAQEVKHYYPNGQLAEEGVLKDGKPIGKWKWYSEKGQLIEVKHFDSNGKRTGKWMTPKQGENEKAVVLYRTYKNGKKNGKYKYYYDNKLTSIGKYKDDEQTGKWKYYYKGKLIKQEHYKNGTLTGKWIAFVEGENGNDNAIIYQTYKDNKKNGDYKYFVNHKLFVSGQYKNNTAIGEWKYYNKKPIDDILAKQTQKIEKAINEKNWTTFISYCNQKQYLFQMQNEIVEGKEQYIYENLNLEISEEMQKKLMKNISYDRYLKIVLKNIKSFKINKIELDDDYFLSYRGTCTFKGKTITFHLCINSDYKITGGFG